MANPLTEERLNQLKDNSTKVLAEFSKLYLKNLGVCLLRHAAKEEEKSEKRLRYRDFDDVPRQELFHDWCYVQEGEGAGAFGGFKRLYVVERQDYNIDLYASDKAYKKGDKPKTTIKIAGYRVQTDVSSHYRHDMRALAAGLGLTDVEVQALTQFSSTSWALSHPVRTNYVFQLHKGSGSACSCLGGGSKVEPDEDPEAAELRRQWITVLRKCVYKVRPRDLDSVRGEAFQETCNAIPGKVVALRHWKDNGTEAEMLVDMLVDGCLPDIRDGILGDLKGPVSMRLSVWYKTRGVIQKTLIQMVDPTWKLMQQGCDTAQQKIEPVLKKGLQPILKVKGDLRNKFRGLIQDKVGALLVKYVTPYIDPILKAFDQPMKDGFQQGRETFVNKVQTQQLPSEQKKRNEVLDAIPRDPTNVVMMIRAARTLVEPLDKLRRLQEEVFQDLDTEELEEEAAVALLTTLDAAVFTLEQQMNAGEATDKAVATILQDYDHDVILVRSEFSQQVVRTILISAFKRLISPVTEPVIDQINSAIPDEMKDFLNIDEILDELIEVIVGEPINKMVDAAYPRQQ